MAKGPDFGGGSIFRNRRKTNRLSIDIGYANGSNERAPDLTGDIEITKACVKKMVEMFKEGDVSVSQRRASENEEVIKLEIAANVREGKQAGTFLSFWLSEAWKPEQKEEPVAEKDEVDIPF